MGNGVQYSQPDMNREHRRSAPQPLKHQDDPRCCLFILAAYCGHRCPGRSFAACLLPLHLQSPLLLPWLIESASKTSSPSQHPPVASALRSAGGNLIIFAPSCEPGFRCGGRAPRSESRYKMSMLYSFHIPMHVKLKAASGSQTVNSMIDDTMINFSVHFIVTEGWFKNPNYHC